jgi:hypothetical protein
LYFTLQIGLRPKVCHFFRGPKFFDLFKGTVSPDIGLHFRFWKIQLILSAGPLMVLKFSYFVVLDIQKLTFKPLLCKHLLIVETLPIADLESLFWLTDLGIRTLGGFQEATFVL